MKNEDLIGKIPLFAGLPRVELEQLAKTLQPCEFPEQAVLFQEDQTDDHCFILLEGQVEIIKAIGGYRRAQPGCALGRGVTGRDESVQPGRGAYRHRTRLHNP